MGPSVSMEVEESKAGRILSTTTTGTIRSQPTETSRILTPIPTCTTTPTTPNSTPTTTLELSAAMVLWCQLPEQPLEPPLEPPLEQSPPSETNLNRLFSLYCLCSPFFSQFDNSNLTSNRNNKPYKVTRFHAKLYL